MTKARSTLQQGTEVLNDLRTEAIDTAKDLATNFHDTVLELAETAGEHADELHERVAESIRRQPWHAVCIAVGIGCVIGLSIARR